MSALKIIVAYDKNARDYRSYFPEYDPEGEIYVPVMGGHALGNIPEQYADMQGDDDGADNISNLNPYIYEISQLYWAWKNLDKLDNPDFIGLNHFRRFYTANTWNQGGVLTPDTIISPTRAGFGVPNVDAMGEARFNPSLKQITLDLIDTLYPNRSTEEQQMHDDFMAHDYLPTSNLFIMPTTKLDDFMSKVMQAIDQLQPVIADSGDGKTYPICAAAKILEFVDGYYFARMMNLEGFRCVQPHILLFS